MNTYEYGVDKNLIPVSLNVPVLRAPEEAEKDQKKYEATAIRSRYQIMPEGYRYGNLVLKDH
jgi:putative salt-induced outer membrane protein YdiY